MKVKQRLLNYLHISQSDLHTSLKYTHDVELLNKIQYLQEDVNLSWKKGRPIWQDNLNSSCGCPHTQAKVDLLRVLTDEYDRRMYEPEDTRRMHINEPD